MNRALVLSDSHRDSISIIQALRLHPEADAVFFLGDGEDDFYTQAVSKLLTDKKVTALAGNCDFYSALPKEEVVQLYGKRIFALHGHTRFVKYGLQGLLDAVRENQADIVLYGHTHIPKVDYADGVYYMCPGSIRQGSYGIVEITQQGEIACFTASL